MEGRVLRFVAPQQVGFTPWRSVSRPAARGGPTCARDVRSRRRDRAASRTGGSWTRPSSSTRPSPRRRERSDIRSLTATAASARSGGWSAGGPGEGTMVFAFHPHQDWFTVPAADLVPVEGVDARVATLPAGRDRAPGLARRRPSARGAGRRPGSRTGRGADGGDVAASGVDVLGVDPRRERRDTASRFGIPVVDASEIREADGVHVGPGMPLVVDATGSPAALPLALELLAHEGEVLVAAGSGPRTFGSRSAGPSTGADSRSGAPRSRRSRRGCRGDGTWLAADVPRSGPDDGAAGEAARHARGVLRRRGGSVCLARPRRRRRHAHRAGVLMFEVGTTASFRAFHRMPGQPPPEDERHAHGGRRGGGREGTARRARHGARSSMSSWRRSRRRSVACASTTCGSPEEPTRDGGVFAAWFHERLAAPLRGDGAEVVAVRVWESAEAFGGVRARVRLGRRARSCGSRW